MAIQIVPTLFDYTLSDIIEPVGTVSKADAERLFAFFSNQPLFKWDQSHNGCEARADAVSVLLDEWNIPNCKAWVFGGEYLKSHVGVLKQNWNYHVAPSVMVDEGNGIVYYVIDPATGNALQRVEDWAANITMLPHSYHFIKDAGWYIFRGDNIAKYNWHERDRQNRKWMIQGLAGINGLSVIGKAQLSFNKIRIKNTATAFKKLSHQSPL